VNFPIFTNLKVTKMKANKPPILPGSTRFGRTNFELHADALYYVDDDGGKHKIVKFGVCANGVRDLCIYWKGPRAGNVSIGKIVDVAKEHILWIPKGDILWMQFTPPLGDRHSLYMDIGSNPTVKDLVREMIRRFPGEKGSDYDMYGGEQYW
jgi:hypothetical protein